MSSDHTMGASGADSSSEFWPPERKQFRLQFNKPSSSEGWVFGFWYRVIIALVCTVPAWITLSLFGAFNNYFLEPWMFFISVSLSIVPLLISEILRRSVFERVVRLEAKTVELRISQTGLKLTAADSRELERFRSQKPTKSDSLYRTYGKRILDITFVIICMPFIAPIMAVIAIFVSMDGHPPFFFERRIGRNGREFNLLRFRTTMPDAEERLRFFLESNPEAVAEWNSNQELKFDPRLTPLGVFLRKTSLEELPQLLNVLKGDMSIIGPRPIKPEQLPLYSESSYYTLRPGLTGLWQISDKTVVSLQARVQFDDTYAKHLSLWGDLRIIAKTVSIVIKETGL